MADRVDIEIYEAELFGFVREAASETVLQKARLAASIAAAIAPRDSGTFAASFEVETSGSTATVTSNDPAGIYKELGTSDTPKHRTMLRALQASAD